MRRPGVPVHQNLLVGSREAARQVARGDLDLRACERCGFVTNAGLRADLLRYGEDYENTQTASPAFARHLDELVERLLAEGVRGKRVVEVGCGKGHFILRLCERGRNTGLGFDPSYVGPDSALDGRVRFVRTFYGREQSESPADIVICRHVIEHVPDPLALLGEVRSALRLADRPRVYFETPDLEWILRGVVVWDLFYEHCSYFTDLSLRNAFRAAQFHVEEVARVFGGQYLWARASVGAAPEPLEPPGERFAEARRAYQAEEASRLARWGEAVQRLSSEGGLLVWGAGAKGVTFVNLLDPAGRLVRGLVDVNPAKAGRFAPGTGHPIVPPSALPAHSPANVILMNPNYLEEVRQTLLDLGLKARLHTAE